MAESNLIAQTGYPQHAVANRLWNGLKKIVVQLVYHTSLEFGHRKRLQVSVANTVHDFCYTTERSNFNDNTYLVGMGIVVVVCTKVSFDRKVGIRLILIGNADSLIQ